MSEPQTLNLIQRAADRLAQRAAASAAGKGAPRASAPVLAYDADRAIETAPAPVFDQTPRRELPKVKFKYSELRAFGMITPDNMMSEISNEFRSVKRDLLMRARDPKTGQLVNNLIMVTSSVPKEGKTFTSCNLALSLAAERDMHVLLIDADPVRQSLGAFFDGQIERGLIDVLAGDVADIADVMHRVDDLPTLSMVFAGRLRPNAPELLASRRMAQLCHELSTRYPDRMIIIDTPPVLGAAEPAMIALHVHQLIMVVAAEQTSRAQLRKSLEGVAGCRNIALLLNKAARWHRPDGGHYYDYYAGSGSVAP